VQLSVVIPARNEATRIRDQLDALLAEPCNGDWEVIVVDNGSTDDTPQVVQDYVDRDARFRLLAATERGGQNYAANAGVRAARARCVAFCDADDVVARGWVSAMMSGLATARVVTGPNELDRLNPPALAGSRGRSVEAPVGTFCGIFPVVRGNNFGVRADVWEQTGPLVEGWKAVHDQEFSFRCWLHGIDIAGVPGAVVHYRYRTSVRELWRQGFAYGTHRARLAKLVRESRRARVPYFSGWKSWAMLLVLAPGVVTRAGRARWVWTAANRLGQAVGSVRERSIML
jgi:glycosyltransferase involved in cell wall biosynthesis